MINNFTVNKVELYQELLKKKLINYALIPPYNFFLKSGSNTSYIFINTLKEVKKQRRVPDCINVKHTRRHKTQTVIIESCHIFSSDILSRRQRVRHRNDITFPGKWTRKEGWMEIYTTRKIFEMDSVIWVVVERWQVKSAPVTAATASSLHLLTQSFTLLLVLLLYVDPLKTDTKLRPFLMSPLLRLQTQ